MSDGIEAVGQRASAHTSSHTSARMPGRIEIVGRVSGRRSWTPEQKLGMLHDAFGPGGSVRAAMERHEVGSGALYTWRHQAMSGTLAATTRRAEAHFAEVQVRKPAAMLSAPSPAAGGTGQIGIELPSGVRLTVDAAVDAEALSRVLGVLAR